MSTRRVFLLCFIAGFVGALFYAAISHASTGDGWRWARYDSKAVKVRVVFDASFPAALIPTLKTAAAAWTTGDLKLDTAAKPVADCATETKPAEICVSSDDRTNCGDAAGCFWPGPSAGVGADGLSLFTYSRVWIRGERGPDGDLQTLCHELGHGIGLGHTEDGPASAPSCMSNDIFSTVPSQDDLDYLRRLYAIRDTKSGPAPRPDPRPKR